MATINQTSTPVNTNGELPAIGSKLPAGTLTSTALADVTIDSFPGFKVLSFFPSVDTAVCATSVRRFNELASAREGVTVLNVSADLPFALKRFCGAEGIDKVHALSVFRSDLGEKLGLRLIDGRLAGLLARAVLVVDAEGTVVYRQLVPEIGQEPDYDAALAALPA